MGCAGEPGRCAGMNLLLNFIRVSTFNAPVLRKAASHQEISCRGGQCKKNVTTLQDRTDVILQKYFLTGLRTEEYEWTYQDCGAGSTIRRHSSRKKPNL
jgi:hypothetical protein